MYRADTLLKSLIRDLGIEDGVKLSEMKRLWNTLFREPLSSHMTPSLLTRGKLLLTVDSPVWLQELNFYKEDILRKLSSYGVGAISFRLGTVLANKKSERGNQKSRARRLTDAEETFVGETVAEIGDDSLKKTLKTTMKKAIASGKTKIRES